MGKMTPIPKGALFTVSSGEYSSYYIHGVFKAKKEIDADQLRSDWLKSHPDQADQYSFEETAFFASLARQGLMEVVACWEWHLSNYRTAESMDVTKITNDAENAGQ